MFKNSRILMRWTVYIEWEATFGTEPPSRQISYKIGDKFETTVSVHNRNKGGRLLNVMIQGKVVGRWMFCE